MQELYKQEIKTISTFSENGKYMGDETDRIGYTKDNYEVYIVTDDKLSIPHFHYRRKKDQNYEFLTFIRIDKAEYLNHGNGYETLNSNQKEELIKFLDSQTADGYETNWEYMLSSWNRNNNMEIIDNLKIPNYLELK